MVVRIFSSTVAAGRTGGASVIGAIAGSGCAETLAVAEAVAETTTGPSGSLGLTKAEVGCPFCRILLAGASRGPVARVVWPEVSVGCFRALVDGARTYHNITPEKQRAAATSRYLFTREGLLSLLLFVSRPRTRRMTTTEGLGHKTGIGGGEAG